MRRVASDGKLPPILIPQLSESAYPVGANYRLQRIPEAWHFLALKLGFDNAFGKPDICVATLDNGVDPKHADVSGKLSNGLPRLIFAYDFEFGRECTDPAYLQFLQREEETNRNTAPSGAHGMAVYGIIAAANESASGIVGIAKNTQQIAIRKLSPTTRPEYEEMYLWVAGLRSEPPSNSGQPANKLPRPADIICICHDTIDMDDHRKSAIDQLVTEGRKVDGVPRGTVIICAAGNTGKPVSGIASHRSTVTVGNTFRLEDGVEFRDRDSCIGPGLDLCAQAQGVMSLTLQPSTIAAFEQTSAAAPMVAATAALMLSVNPWLTSKEVGDILRDCANRKGLADHDIPEIEKNPKKFAERFGHGRLDVFAAVKSAWSTLPKPTMTSKAKKLHRPCNLRVASK